MSKNILIFIILILFTINFVGEFIYDFFSGLHVFVSDRFRYLKIDRILYSYDCRSYNYSGVHKFVRVEGVFYDLKETVNCTKVKEKLSECEYVSWAAYMGYPNKFIDECRKWVDSL